MSEDGVLGQLCARGVIPVVVVDDALDAQPLGDALKAGGLPVAEVTFRTDAAAEALALLAHDPALVVGAGTVVSAEQVNLALDAGASFIVTPGFSKRVVERCREVGIAVIPGVATATEVIAALDCGIELVKLFPAEASGGLAMVRALHAPFPQVRLIPTGGVSAANAAAYLEHPGVAAVGGSWMVSGELIRQGDFQSVARLAAEAVAIAAEARA